MNDTTTKFRRNAALALVGGYLMFPPQALLDAGAIPDHPAKSVAGWTIKRTFPTRDACLEQEAGFRGFARLPPNDYKFARNPMSYAECVASDDPRLKSN
jgi:hypothetical protein